MRWLLPLVLLLAGCSGHTHSSVSFGAVSTHGSVHTHIEGGAGLAALLGIAIIAANVTEYERGPYSVSNPRYVPEMDPGRKVSEQDCTKPIDWSLGNIRCK